MSAIESLKEKYQQDADMMSTKSRFGYFSILPSHTAAIPDFQQIKHEKEEDGKPVTEPRNIFSGPTSTGSLKKNFFSYVPSAFNGSMYQDPGKHDRQLQMKQNKTMQGKEIFKPARLNKTLAKASYEYMSQNDPKKDQKNYRDADGNVITRSPNMLVNPQSKIQYESDKKFIYKEEKPIEKIRKAKEEQKEIEPFKTGYPKKDIFYSNVQTFYDTDIKKTESKKTLRRVASHEGPFKPSCTAPGKPFTPVRYKEQGEDKLKKVSKQNTATRQAFKLTKVEYNSKPTPSIAYSKINLRCCR